MIDSLQLTAKHQVATPVNWKPGEDVIIAGSVSDEEAKRRYPQGWKAPKPYSASSRSRNEDLPSVRAGLAITDSESVREQAAAEVSRMGLRGSGRGKNVN